MIAEVANATAPAAEVRGERVVTEGDPTELERLLVNLVENARRFSRERVLIETACSHGMAELTVADDGPGFAPALLPAVFDRFTRGNSSRGRGDGGTGLGLALVAAIVRSHGGTVTAANGPPLGGAVVRVALPGAEGV